MESNKHLPQQSRERAASLHSTADLTDAERQQDDRHSDCRDQYADAADAAADARDRAANVRDAAAGDSAAADVLPTGQRRAVRDRKAAANDRAQAGGDRSRARGDRTTSRRSRGYAAEDRSKASEAVAELGELLRRAERNAADMRAIGEAEDLLMTTRSLSAIEAVAHLCTRAARDHSELADAAKSVLAEAAASPPEAGK